MSKKVLILSASPHKGGNSDTLADEFLRGALDAGNDAEKIFLRDKTINYCMGCEACKATHSCVQKDDMAEILDKMVACDVLVMATPAYFYTMDARMKALVDRTLPRYKEMAGKDFYFIIAGATGNAAHLERVLESFRGFSLDCVPDSHEKGVIFAAAMRKPGDAKASPELAKAYDMGKSI